MAEQTTPRVYMASLSDYNAGRLHGRWISADQDADAIGEQITEMVAASREPWAEEWAIHDYEGFGPVRLHEYESIERVAAIAQGIGEHGAAFAHWIGLFSPAEEERDQWGEQFQDAYQGHFDSLEQYARQLCEDCYGINPDDPGGDDPKWKGLNSYLRVDLEAWGRDLDIEMATSEGDGGVYVFHQG